MAEHSTCCRAGMDELGQDSQRGRGQGDHTGQVSQPHTQFISHSARKTRNAMDARKMCYDLNSDAPALKHCVISDVLSLFPLMFCYQYHLSLPSLGEVLRFRKL